MSDKLFMDVKKLHKTIVRALMVPSQVMEPSEKLTSMCESFTKGKYGFKLFQGEEVMFAYFTGVGPTTKSSIVFMTNGRLVEIYEGLSKHMIWLHQVARCDHTQHVLSEDTCKITHLDGHVEKVHVFFADVCAFYVSAIKIVCSGKVPFTLTPDDRCRTQLKEYVSHAKRVKCPSCSSIIQPPLGHSRFKCPACKSTLDYQKKAAHIDVARGDLPKITTSTSTSSNMSPEAELEWRCPGCCYINRGQKLSCSMCSAPRPSETPKNSNTHTVKKKPSLGVDVKPCNGGMLVTRVVDNLPGALAGLRVDDVINTINGFEIETPKDFFNQYAAIETDTNICLAAHRGGKEIAFIIKPIWTNPHVYKRDVAPPASAPKATPQPVAKEPAKVKAPVTVDSEPDFLSGDIFGTDYIDFFAVPAPEVKEEKEEKARRTLPTGTSYTEMHSHKKEAPEDPFDFFETKLMM